MSAFSVSKPFVVFSNADGSPLDDGYVYIGTAGLNPESSPVKLYWDKDLTIPAAQPVRTIGGYPSRNGSPGVLYVNADDYSITVRTKNKQLVHSALTTGVSLPFSSVTGDIPASRVIYGNGNVEEALDLLIGDASPILMAIAGQSNAEGVNSGGLNPANEDVRTWDAVLGAFGGSDYTALPWTRPNPDGNSGNNNFALAAAHYITEVTGRKVYIVYDAVGGTSIDAWVENGTSSTRYVALKSKIENALNSPEMVAAGKTSVDYLIWAQGEEDFESPFGVYLPKLDTLDEQLRDEIWFGEFTPIFIMGMSPLHDRYQISAALRHFSHKSNGKWRYVSTRSLRTEFQETGAGDYTHWLGPSLWQGGYNLLGPAIVGNEITSEEDNDGLFWNRGGGNAVVSDSTVIASFKSLVNWSSRTAGMLSEEFDGTGSEQDFTLDYRGVTVDTVLVDDVEQALNIDYTLATDDKEYITLSFTTAPPLGNDNVVVKYPAAISGPASTDSISYGYACNADGNQSFAGGYQCMTNNTANYVIAYGRDVYAGPTSDYSAGFGFQITLSATYTLGAGRGHILADSGAAAIGTFSEYTTSQADPVMFQAGVGTSSSARKNGLAVRKSGLVEMRELDNHVYADDSAAGIGGLIQGQVYMTSAGELRIKL